MRLANVATATSAQPDGESEWTHGMIASSLAAMELTPLRVRG